MISNAPDWIDVFVLLIDPEDLYVVVALGGPGRRPETHKQYLVITVDKEGVQGPQACSPVSIVPL
jgi:hypothetical protein